ncbi:MFS transporter [Rhizobium sp. P32RR-XVIII]|uniref:MFS transporter n=1 Tax=Rhizobium sp. P32RR-XVIII TaxID=2726738 RepID=UPI001FEE03D3|nr:MFS transporter [Rhizobium sp. P32RR-XVIII]
MTKNMETAPQAPAQGGFGPLRQPVFAVLWAASVLGNTGTFIRDVASSWLVTDLSDSPAAVAMVQAAGTLPIFLLAIPAGVMSDILDRRKFLIVIQLGLAAVSATLVALSYSGLLSVSSLVALTFMGGIGAALMGPTWQSIVPELVPRESLKSAVALNSLGVNIARSIGPAAGGFLLAAFGAALTYGIDVLSYIFVIAALIWWPRPRDADDALSERFFGAFRAGLRYTRASRELHIVLLRAAIFFAFSSSIWTLLPLLARNNLGGDARFYGFLLGAVGVGAIAGAFLLPTLRRRFDNDGLLLRAAIVTSIVMMILSFAPPQWIAILVLVVLGGAWIVALTTLNGAAQAILPNWVRGRALAVYLTVFNGAMAAGSIGWGAVAQAVGISTTLQVGAVGLFLIGIVLNRIKLPAGEADLVPSNHWPEPLTAEPVEHDRGPVLILIEYRVHKEQQAEFLKFLAQLSAERRRDGAYNWGVTEDAADPEKIVEWFLVESWVEHLRQHKRVSKADADLQQETLKYHVGPEKPVVRHLLSTDARRNLTPENNSQKP